jgi:hypothetical protein
MGKTNPTPERRSGPRRDQVRDLSVCDAGGYGRVAGLQFNRSETGIYFETDVRLDPGSKVYIGAHPSGATTGYSFRLAWIVWCRALGATGRLAYGCGACFLKDSAGTAPVAGERRRHTRLVFSKDIRITDEGLTYGGSARDISPSGIFVISSKEPRAGQTLSLEIPDKTGGVVTVRAKVIWSSATGFGLKFIR